jgi:hypothetical protein
MKGLACHALFLESPLDVEHTRWMACAPHTIRKVPHTICTVTRRAAHSHLGCCTSLETGRRVSLTVELREGRVTSGRRPLVAHTCGTIRTIGVTVRPRFSYVLMDCRHAWRRCQQKRYMRHSTMQPYTCPASGAHAASDAVCAPRVAS